MKKFLIILIFFVLISSSFVLAAPPWKQQSTKSTTTTTTASKPTTVVYNQTTIIVQNNTAPPKEEGIGWEGLGAITGIIAVIAGFIGWLPTRRGRSKASSYIKDISETFNKYKNDASKCEAELYRMKEHVEGDFSKGKISEESFNMLDSRIDKYLAEVRRGIVTTFELSPKVRKELHDMLKDGVISEEEHKKFSKMDTSQLSKSEKSRLESLMKKWRQKKK